MKNNNTNFALQYFLMVLIQMVLSSCFQLSPFVTLTILPAIVFCIPLTTSAVSAMIIAFATGLGVDLLSDGLLGLNALSLVPVAFMREPIIKSTLGKDIVIRQDGFSFRKCGSLKMTSAIVMESGIFLLIYILADGAGTRPLWFNAAHFAASLLGSVLLSVIAVRVLTANVTR